jgi:aquaporin Z
MLRLLRGHWQEYLIEAAGLGMFMIAACGFTVLLVHPASPARRWIVGGFSRRMAIGVAMGLTATALIYSPWGKRSGAHFNPAVTFAFFRLGKVGPGDTFFYIISQFAGAIGGVWVSAVLLGRWISHPAVRYAVTTPGTYGAAVAFVGELVISFWLMGVVLLVSNSATWPAFTGVFAGVLVATYITLEAPLSGMSMNPARTLGSALLAHVWTAWWIYFTAPPIGMLLAASVYLSQRGTRGVLCAKLHHQNDKPCIFRCGYRQSTDAR